MPKKIKWGKITNSMLQSEAFNALSASAIKILLHTLTQQYWENTAKAREKPRWVCSNKDSIKIPYIKFRNVPYNMSNMTITRAIDSLLARGFITIVAKGGVIGEGHMTKYGAVTHWERWAEGAPPIELREKSKRAGFQMKRPAKKTGGMV